jgi:23S rRNA pseudouridine1911/1915/1917 synthase
MQKYKVGPDEAGVRVDVFVAEKYPQFARAALSILFDKKIVLLNGKAAKAGTKVKAGDIISLDDSKLFNQPEEIDIPILFEDENIIVMNKPAGVLTHSKGSLNSEATVASFIKPKITDEKLTGNRAGIVHRLDRTTSGVIIAAKNAQALSWLQKQFSTRKTKKTYFAIVEGWPEPKQAIIDAPIARNPKKPQTFMVAGAGKSAQTEYQIIKKSEKKGRKFALLELKPTTGRTHQLRIHMAYIGHPIVGDKVYGHEGDQTYLHAAKLELTLPNRERRIFEVPLPDKFKEFINS